MKTLNVLLEVSLEGGSVRTKGASKGSFARVGEQMALEVLTTVAAVELLAAHGTD